MKRICLLCGLVACHSKPSDNVFLIDAPSDTSKQIDASQEGPNTIDLTLYGGTDPDLITYRDGTGSWIVPTATMPGTYRLHVTNAYEVVVVCSLDANVASSYDAQELAATIADGAHQYMYCASNGGPPPATVAVTGMMTQAGEVAMGDTATSSTAPWSFNLDVYPGTHDLLAIGNGRMLLDRDIQIAAATALPTVDVVANGLVMPTATLALTGAGSDTLHTTFDMYTDNEAVTISDTANTTVALPPPSLVHTNDFSYLTVVAQQGQTTRRMIDVSNYDGSTTAFTFPAVLSGITYTTATGVTATWAQLPAATSIEFYMFTGTAPYGELYVSATKSWIDATGATSLAFDTSAPGYLPAWLPDLTAPYYRVFGIYNYAAGVGYASQLAEAVNGAAATTREWKSLAEPNHHEMRGLRSVNTSQRALGDARRRWVSHHQP